jgi:deazaflavin-dependent oxidoreductase (nitroreductase family)
MSDGKLEASSLSLLTARGLAGMAAEVGTEAGPGATTRAFNRAFIEAFRSNGGVIPGELQRANFLLLTTIGAKSGTSQTTPLVYHRIDEQLLVIASTGGRSRHPRWYDNLVANPSVIVELGTETYAARAVVHAGAHRDALFAAVVKGAPGFGAYQERTERVIPVVELVRAQ